MENPKEKFSHRADDYKKYRPGYPPEIIPFLTEKCGLTPSSSIADIGSGTGIFTKLLLQRGFTVKAVEPNESMRRQAESDLSSFRNFESIDGSAENTTLEPASIDLITSCQAFHWFDHDTCKVEFRRILRTKGYVALIWNERLLNTPFMSGYESLLNELEHTKMVDKDAISAFYAPNQYEIVNFSNKQVFDWTGIRGRFLSSSYAPKEGEKGHVESLEKLRSLFDDHNEHGHIDFNYCEVRWIS